VSGPGSTDIEQLKAAAGVMGSIIADEHPAARAMILEGVGPQLRIYCRYGMKAVEDGGGVDALTWNPTAGDWTLHVPCDSENIEWLRASITKISTRIKVFDVAEAALAEEDNNIGVDKNDTSLIVDWNFR
jgi:hypothetical protein